MLLKAIIIKSSAQIKDARTIASIYYLLKGKRSIQTVQDAHLYRLERFYGIYKQLNKSHYDIVIHELVSDGYLFPQTTNSCRPTALGKEWLAKNKLNLSYSYLNGLKYNSIDHIFLERLLLLIQVLTNSKMRNASYIPVIDKISTTDWVKSIYKQLGPNVNGSLQGIYEELLVLLNNYPIRQSNMFVDRLTGFKDYGMSINQLADHYEIDIHDVQIQFTGMIHGMLDTIVKEKFDFPLLSFLVRDLQVNGFITDSAQRTNELIKNNNSIEEIAMRRQLKVNTIYDHIVEISLYDPRFKIDSYVGISSQQEILSAVETTKSTQLKHIKDKVNLGISYFQIRLTLAATHHRLK